MKKFLVILVMSLMSASLFAADATPDEAKKAEMMKLWKDASTPGPEHKMLSQFAGRWTYTSKMWESADAKPEESKGTANLKMILGGRYLQNESKGKAMGMPFEGLGFTGYDNIKKVYTTLWLDNFSTGVMAGTGTYDDASKTLTDKGTYTCPMSKTPDHQRSYRTEWKSIDKNNMTFTMYGPGEDGKEFKQMELVFKRK